MAKTIKVLFVCLGNICRSPTAEGIFKNKIREKNLVESFVHDSAGTSAYHEGGPSDSRSMDYAKTQGVDLSFIRSRKLKDQDYYEFDHILAMDSRNYQEIIDDKPFNATAKIEMMLDYHPDEKYQNVPDPYYGNGDGFKLVFDLLDEAVEQFIKKQLP
ncbi:MAG: low molecular weight protein-tyrosine-phosphatase [Bdellovibrionales bacterium]